MKRILCFVGPLLWSCLLFAQDQTNPVSIFGPPYFVVKPGNVTVHSGSFATFSSSAQGNPAPTYSWMFNGQQVSTSPNLTIFAHAADAGTYSVSAYNGLGSDGPYSATLTVLPNPQAIHYTAPGNKALGAPPFQISASADSGLALKFAASGPATVSSGGLVTLTGAGAVSIQLSQAGDADWQPAAPVVVKFTVSPATLTVSGISALNKVYDGTTAATVNASGAGLNGVLPADVGNVTLVTAGAVGTFADAKPGINKTVNVSGLALSGHAAGNYNLTQPTVTASISSLGLTVSGITVVKKVYDGTTSATLDTSGASLNGVLAADSGNVTLITTGATGTFADSGVGNGRSVNVSGLSLAGSAAPNYTIIQPPITGNIVPADVTVLAGLAANNKVYDGRTAATLSSNNVVLSGVLSTDTMNVTFSTNGYSASFYTATVGTDKPITISGLSLTGSAAPNYSLIPPELTATIAPANLIVTADNKTRVAGTDNPPFDGVISGLRNSDNISVSYSCTADVNSPPGTYPIVPILSDPNNVLVNYSVVIQQGTLTVISVSAPSFLGANLVGQTFSTSIITTPGLIYVLESKQSLTDTGWTQVDQQTGTGSTITLRDSAAIGGLGFYRVRAHP